MGRRTFFAFPLCVLVFPSFQLGHALVQSPASNLPKTCESASTIDFGQAEGLAIERGRADLPPLAKQLGLKGVVRLETCISEIGDVILVKSLGGSPILIPPAIESVKKWKFRPLVLDGKPVSFKTIIEVSYLQGSTPAQVAHEQAGNERYFKVEGTCRASLKAKNFEQAEVHCKDALDLVDRLPAERVMERQTANGLVGQTLFAERNFDGALPFFQRELAIAKSHQKPDEAELAYAYHHVALTFHDLVAFRML